MVYIRIVYWMISVACDLNIWPKWPICLSNDGALRHCNRLANGPLLKIVRAYRDLPWNQPPFRVNTMPVGFPGSKTVRPQRCPNGTPRRLPQGQRPFGEHNKLPFRKEKNSSIDQFNHKRGINKAKTGKPGPQNWSAGQCVGLMTRTMALPGLPSTYKTSRAWLVGDSSPSTEQITPHTHRSYRAR